MQEIPVAYLGKRKWRLVEGYACRLKISGQTKEIRIHAGFVFDLASIPRIFWRLIAPFELSIAAPLVHDFLYRGGCPGATRAEADAAFLDLMGRERVPLWRRRLAYLAVRVFGRFAWRGAA